MIGDDDDDDAAAVDDDDAAADDDDAAAADDDAAAAHAPAAFNPASICPLFGCVDATVPIGQVSYFSPVSGRREMLPVTVNLVVRRGCDFVLFNMIGKMADAGLLQTVKTGKTAF
jgi:hypothetical protein